MKSSSAKAKGRNLQKLVVEKILNKHPSLDESDVRSCPMGSHGEDIQLSQEARKLLPLSIECKSKASWAFYKYLDQAWSNAPKGTEGILVAKANHKSPVAILDLDYFLKHYNSREVKNRK